MMPPRVFWSLALLSFAACGSGSKPTESEALTPVVPDAIRVPSGQRPFLKVLGKGVQIYTCKADAAGAFAWALKAPEATLLNGAGTPVGTHYAGPTWEAKDGSKGVGEVQARADSPNPTAIPWLLLRAKSTSGSGTLGRTTFIHRLDTVGGQAPAGGCDASKADSETRVDYSATYYFYAAAL